MEARFFKFPNITNFEEVYIVIDKEKKRLHMSPVNYTVKCLDCGYETTEIHTQHTN
jgi:predicted Zn-ribbon and HTH transcriptional regulator